MIVKGFLFIFGIAFIFLFAQSGGQENHSVKEGPTLNLIDTLSRRIKETKKVLDSVNFKLDSIQHITFTLKNIELSHDYRVYRYKINGNRNALIYKWQKGTPGYWQLINKVNY